MKISKQHLPIGKKRRGTRINPKKITIHSTGNPRSTPQNERDYLQNPVNTNSTGWHYVVGDNIIIEAIPPNERAFHAGHSVGNNTSIGIEMVETGDRSKVIANTIKLIKHLQKIYNISDSNVVRHYDWTKKNCPRILNYNNWQGWVEFKTLLRSDDTMTEKTVRAIVQDEIKKVESERADKPVSKWAKDAVDFVQKEKLLEGYKDGSFKGRNYVTREQLAVVLQRVYEDIK